MRTRLMVTLTVLAMLGTGCTADLATPAPPEHREALEVTVAPVIEPGFELFLPAELAHGDGPSADADCAAAYRWARKKGAYAAMGSHQRITITATRYAQVIPDLVRIKIEPSAQQVVASAHFLCGDVAAATPESEPETVDLFVPSPVTGETELSQHSYLHWGNTTARYALGAGKSATLPVHLMTDDDTPSTEFTIQLLAKVNGTTEIYELGDGDQPFAFGPLPAGGGYHVATYLWCPGSPGHLDYTPAGPAQGRFPTCG